MLVTKRDGSKEQLDMEKSNRVLEWACEGVAGTSASDIAMKAVPRLFDGIQTHQLHLSYIQAAEELIKENHAYAEVESRLLIIDLLKSVYGDWDTIKPLKQVVRDNIDRGFYDVRLLEYYSDEEWNMIELWIDHKRDYSIMAAGMKQFKDKYLTQDRSTKQIFETPQVAYMLAAAAGLSNLPKANRMQQIKRTYNAFSKAKISLPTPVLAGVRQQSKQFASCVLIDMGDNLDSINDTCRAANMYASKRAGLGINAGRLRPVGSKVGSGEVVHTGVIPFLRQLEASIKSCSQGGIRDASATVYFPAWHYEIEDILVLKSPKVTHEKAVRRLDYGIQWDTFLKRRAKQRKTMTLFSPAEVPDLYEAFFGKDRAIFEALYEKYEKDTTLKFRREIDARTLHENFLTQSSETGRYYEFSADHVNTHTPFKKPIYMSNLCVEVCLPTEEIHNKYYDYDFVKRESRVVHEGLVQICILGAINVGTLDIDNPKDMEDRMNVLVVFLNELIDFQDYTVPQSEQATRMYRPLGIGMVNYAYFLAKRGLRYGDQAALDLTHRLSEQMYYYALKASVGVAKARGERLPAFDQLIYADGKTLLDTYNKNVDKLTTEPLHCDWTTLIADIDKYGIYNSTFGAFMPSESSSTVLNATSGFDPIRALITSKSNKKISFNQVAPEANKLKDAYDYLWNMTPDRMDGYIKTAAVIQKFCCQSISTNLSYNPEHYPDTDPNKNHKVPLQVLMNHTALCTIYGVKTRYYVNTKGEDKDKVEKMSVESENQVEEETMDEGDGCESGACRI